MLISRIVRRIVMRPFIYLGILLAFMLLCGCVCAAALSGSRNQGSPAFDQAPIMYVIAPVLLA